MKIRIKDNSLRLRLTQGEVETIKFNGLYSTSVSFPGGARLTYGLAVKGDEVSAFYDQQGIWVHVPSQMVETWLQPHEVGMEALLDLPNGDKLRVLIEKDFACLTERTDEDESDNFPNPLAHC